MTNNAFNFFFFGRRKKEARNRNHVTGTEFGWRLLKDHLIFTSVHVYRYDFKMHAHGLIFFDLLQCFIVFLSYVLLFVDGKENS